MTLALRCVVAGERMTEREETERERERGKTNLKEEGKKVKKPIE